MWRAKDIIPKHLHFDLNWTVTLQKASIHYRWWFFILLFSSLSQILCYGLTLSPATFIETRNYFLVCACMWCFYVYMYANFSSNYLLLLPESCLVITELILLILLLTPMFISTQSLWLMPALVLLYFILFCYLLNIAY